VSLFPPCFSLFCEASSPYIQLYRASAGERCEHRRRLLFLAQGHGAYRVWGFILQLGPAQDVKVRDHVPCKRVSRPGTSYSPWSRRLLCKCHHILYCRDAVMCCRPMYSCTSQVVSLLLSLRLNWDFRCKFFWVRHTHWTIFYGCIRTHCYQEVGAYALWAPWRVRGGARPPNALWWIFWAENHAFGDTKSTITYLFVSQLEFWIDIVRK